MAQQQIVLKLFEYAILLFALSLHEASHAWMASRLGDPTARMLGRVTLNPLKHIDPLGTVVIPLVMMFLPGFGRFLIGWAKPTPVTTRNFKNIRRDDILTTLAGPVSNAAAAVVAFTALMVLKQIGEAGAESVFAAVYVGGHGAVANGPLPTMFPVALVLYLAILLNVFLAAFNLLPLPPLDGSHIIRHMLPPNALRVYDSLGMLSLILMLVIGGPIVRMVTGPALAIFDAVLLSGMR
jgi:Zn-dependent protease